MDEYDAKLADYLGYDPTAARRTLPDAPPAASPAGVVLGIVLLNRGHSAYRMSRVAYGIARVSLTRGPHLVTLHTDTLAPSGATVRLAGLAPRASRHVAGTVSLVWRGSQLGPDVPWSCSQMAGDARLQALPLHEPASGCWYLYTRTLTSTLRMMEPLLT